MCTWINDLINGNISKRLTKRKRSNFELEQMWEYIKLSTFFLQNNRVRIKGYTMDNKHISLQDVGETNRLSARDPNYGF